MINKEKITAAMHRRDLTGSQTAEYLGISMRSFSRKLNEETDFTASEIETLCRLLHIKNPVPYFFCRVLANRDNDSE